MAEPIQTERIVEAMAIVAHRRRLERSGYDQALIEAIVSADPPTAAELDDAQAALSTAFPMIRAHFAWIAQQRADDLAHGPEPEFEDHRQFANGAEHEARMIATAIRTTELPLAEKDQNQ